MRILKTALFTSASLFLLLQLHPAQAAKQARPAWVLGSSVNVRKGPGTDSATIGQLKKGTKVYAVAFNGGWCKIKTPSGKYGWVLEKLLQFSQDKGRALAQTTGAGTSGGSSAQAAWVKAEAANVRAEPGTTAKDIGTLKQGAKVFVVARSGDWSKVKLPNNVYGWVATWLLTTSPDQGHQLAKASPAVQSGVKAFVQGDNVNLRGGPGTSQPKIAALPEGYTVWVTGASGQWRKVRLGNGTTGWMAGWLLKYPSATPSQPKTVVADKSFDALPAWIGDTVTNVRSGPGTDYGVKGGAAPGDKVYIVSIDGQWCKVKLPGGGYGWVAGWALDYSKGREVTAEVAGREVDVRVGWVARDQVNLRSGPGTTYSETAEAVKGTEVVILDKAGSWYKVALSNGKTGYMLSELIDTRGERIVRKELADQGSPSSSSSGARLASARAGARSTGGGSPSYDPGRSNSVVETAMRYRGTPYRRGGSDPSGFDCSGFVQHVMGKQGVNVSHDSRALFGQGNAVSRDNLRPGDVVFFENTYRAGISHVGIYIGNGQFIHASNSRSNVKVSDLDSDYYRSRYAGARRMK